MLNGRTITRKMATKERDVKWLGVSNFLNECKRRKLKRRTVQSCHICVICWVNIEARASDLYLHLKYQPFVKYLIKD
jgi:hypothetical protein